MLELKNIRKIYETGGTSLAALDGVSLCFRENEFVSILGPSGCGKTTLLNIVGGLDRYSDGDLIINGRSTKFYKDKDWDTYRNHSIGFVFQSYNLIPHQTVLANVELALTLSGVSKSERKARATEALKKVGLGDQLNKKPNQMSGGQMQRVAIARALVNNPDILLADEPTGALDTQTSVQIMDLLKEVAKDRLVIMVTHNPDLAREYSTRIVSLSDGKIVNDTNPVTAEEYEAFASKDKAALIQLKKDKKALKAINKKKSMSFATAVSLSFKNLLTKKGRTILTSFAGSIGIIGIALILSLSNGINIFIEQVQEDTLSTYPLTIKDRTTDTSAVMDAMMSSEADEDIKREPDRIYVDDSLDKMIEAMMSSTENDLVSFKEYLEKNNDKIEPYVSDIQYTYDLDLKVFNTVTTVNEETKKETVDYRELGVKEIFENLQDLQGLGDLISGSDMFNPMKEMINNQDLLDQQYDCIKGNWPQNYDEVVLVVNADNSLSTLTLYMLGILDPEDLQDVLLTNYTHNELEKESYSFDELLGMKLTLLNKPDTFIKDPEGRTYTVGEGENKKELPIWVESTAYATGNVGKLLEEKGIELKISGIVRPRADATAASISGPLGYTKALTDKLLEMNKESEIIIQQRENRSVNVLTGMDFTRTEYTPENIHELLAKIDSSKKNQFYSIMSTEILKNPEYLARFTVTDETFAQMFLLMPSENKSAILTPILSSDGVKNNPEATAALFSIASMLSQPEIGITAENCIQLLPVMNPAQLLLLLDKTAAQESLPKEVTSLIPEMVWATLKDLPTLAGDETMSAIYEGMNETVKTITVNDEILSAILATLDGESEEFKKIEETLYDLATDVDDSYETVEKTLGAAEAASPASINFYAKDFDSKEKIEEFIAEYNKPFTADTATEEEKAKKIEYTDMIGDLMSSVTIIIDVISYVLIAFVSISLVVSSIMIGIITNISVLERTKEIGILRAIGASKKDISRVFNAETFIVGLIAGVLGILITVLLCIPANALIVAITGFANVKAVLPPVAAIILILISMGLTMIAGLIPSRKASKKDPVVALRTE